MDRTKLSSTDNLGRRKWDANAIAAKKAAAENVEKEIKKQKKLHPVHREELKGRNEDLELEKDIGTQKVLHVTAPLSQQGGYYCDVCECVLKDSQSYLDHLNGRKHNRALGMSMRVRKADASAVSQRLNYLKEKAAQSKKEAAAAAASKN